MTITGKTLPSFKPYSFYKPIDGGFIYDRYSTGLRP